MVKPLLCLVSLAALLFNTPIRAQPVDSGGVLRAPGGQSLYTFSKDLPGESKCYDGCAAAWPPLMAAEGAAAKGAWTLHARKDGGQQWGWNGRPLYRFAGDTRPGETQGDGQGGVWHLARSQAANAAPVSGGRGNSSY